LAVQLSSEQELCFARILFLVAFQLLQELHPQEQQLSGQVEE
jgi:hypothetical protein